MSDAYLGEIRIFGGDYAPAGWMFCDGQLLEISDKTRELFRVLGTKFGGDGQKNFALPDLRGRVAMHQGNQRSFASHGGQEAVSLTIEQMPVHSHRPRVNSATATEPSVVQVRSYSLKPKYPGTRIRQSAQPRTRELSLPRLTRSGRRQVRWPCRLIAHPVASQIPQ